MYELSCLVLPLKLTLKLKLKLTDSCNTRKSPTRWFFIPFLHFPNNTLVGVFFVLKAAAIAGTIVIATVVNGSGKALLELTSEKTCLSRNRHVLPEKKQCNKYNYNALYSTLASFPVGWQIRHRNVFGREKQANS